MTAARARGAGRGAAASGGDELRRWARGTLLSSFPGDTVPSWVWRHAEGGLGGVCLYGSNRGADVAGVAAALHGVRPELVVALDEEGGDVTRIEAATGSSVPGNAALGAVDDVDLTRRVAAALGAVLRSVGVDLDLAPCADVNSDPANPVIGVRSFGADAALVARHTAAFVDGLQAGGVAACAKHFPGHGAVAVDSHVALPTVDVPADVLRVRELAPFRAAIAAGVAAVMPGHLLVPALDAAPATVSRAVVTGLLRGELGFAGLVVTDALDMGGVGGPAVIPANVVRALAAGADLCCLGPGNDQALVEACVEAVLAAVAAGDLAAERLGEAAARVAALRPSLAPAPAVVAAGRAAVSRPEPDEPAPLSADTCADGRQNREAGRARVEPASLSAHPRAAGRHKAGVGPAGVEPAPDVTLAAVGAEAARRAIRVDGPLPTPLVGALVVELDRPTNVAAGPVPWGVAGALAALDAAVTADRIAEGDEPAVASALAAAAGRPLVVAVRDPQRRPAQAAALRALLAARPDAVVVDMGWPGDPAVRPAAAAWITAHGASRASGDAVARLLAGAPEPPAPPAAPARFAPPCSPTAQGGTARG